MIHKIEEQLTPRDLPDFAARWDAYRADPAGRNPLDDFVPDQWRAAEDYDDQWPAGTDPNVPAKPSVADYMLAREAMNGRACRLAAL